MLEKIYFRFIARIWGLRSKPRSIPIEVNHKLANTEECLLKDPIVYRQLIGKLIYLNFTRLDICCVVHILSQYMERPAEAHLNVTFNVLKYLKSSLGLGVLLSTNSTMQLKIFVDSD